MRLFSTVRKNETRFGISIYLLCVILGIVICVSQYSLTSGFRKGEAYEASVLRSEVSRTRIDAWLQGVPDDFDRAAAKYFLILSMFSLVFVLKCVVDARIQRVISLVAFCVCAVTLWDVLKLKLLAFRYRDTARFDMFRETIPFDIFVAAILLTVILIDVVSLVSGREGRNFGGNEHGQSIED